MTPLLLPYVFNIAVLAPIGSLTPAGGERGGQVACPGKSVGRRSPLRSDEDEPDGKCTVGSVGTITSAAPGA